MLDQRKISMHDGFLIDKSRLQGVHVEVDFTVPRRDTHNNVLIDVHCLADLDARIDDIALFEIVLDVDLNINVLVELDILVHLDGTAKRSIADLQVDCHVLLDVDRVAQEDVHVKRPVFIVDFEFDRDVLIYARLLIELNDEMTVTINAESNVDVLVHEKVLIDVEAGHHLTDIAADKDAGVLFNVGDLGDIDTVDVVGRAGYRVRTLAVSVLRPWASSTNMSALPTLLGLVAPR